MRKWALAIVALLLGPQPVRAQEAVGRRSVSDFQQVADVWTDQPLTAGSAYSVDLTAESVAALRGGGELRVFDADGREIPSVMYTAHAQRALVDRPVSIFNQAWEPGLVQTLTVELQESPPQSVNEFVFDLADEQYNVEVQVEGSENALEWRIIGEKLHLIRHQIPGEAIKYEHNVLRIPTSRYPYFRFTIAASGRTQPLDVRAVAVRQAESRGATLDVRADPVRWNNPADPDARHHYWKLDLGRANLGIDRLRLTMEGADFARSGSLWEWNDELSRLGGRLAGAVLFRYGVDEQLTFGGFQSDARVLVLMIDQGDNPPVRVIGATARRPKQSVRFLLDAPPATPVRLYFDPERAQTPSYDLDRRLRERQITEYTTLTHGPVRANPQFAKAPPPASERVPYLLYALVIPLVLGLGWYIARTIRAGVPSEDSDPD